MGWHFLVDEIEDENFITNLHSITASADDTLSERFVFEASVYRFPLDSHVTTACNSPFEWKILQDLSY